MYYGLNLSLGGVGSYVGSALLADIIYDGTLLNVSATRYLKDIGSVPLDNATLYSGRAKQFATDMSMPIDIPYSLGSDLFASRTTYTTSTLTQTSITDGYNYVHNGTSGTAECFTNLSPAIQDGDTVVHTFDAIVNSGTVTLLDGQTITNGSNTIIAINALSGGDRSYFRFVDGVAFDFDIINETAQKATATAKHLYKFDHDTDTFIYDELTDDQIQYHLARVNGYSDGAYEDKTYGLVNVFTSELSTADFNLMTSEPEAIVNMVANDVADTRFTVTKSDCKVCMPLTEDGEYCRNYAEDRVFQENFSSISLWTAYNAVISHVDDTAMLVDDSASAGSYSSGYHSLTTEIGQEYVLMWEQYDYDGSNGSYVTVFKDAMEGSILGGATTIQANGVFDTTFTATSTTSVIALAVNGSGNIKFKWATVDKIENISEILNYETLPAPDIRALSTGLQTTPFKLDSIGMIDGVGDGTEMHGAEKAVIPTRTKTADITIEITPSTIESILLVDTTVGDITMNANGTVTASSGSVAIDTTTLQVDVKSIVTVTGISIDGASTLHDALDGTVHNYREETA